MKYISMFSGIEAASVAWEPLGWTPVVFAEIEPFPCAVLAQRWPRVPNVGDITAVDWSQYRGTADLIVGGPPCQAFSVAGLRRSLDDERGNLSLAYVRAVDAIDPQWVVTENVPGWLSTADNAFGCFLAAMVGSDAPLLPPRGQRWTDAGVVTGPRRTATWRILDAQYCRVDGYPRAVPQRRRRVFVVAVRNPRGWRSPAALLPVGESLSGHPAPRREAGKGIAGTVAASPPSRRNGGSEPTPGHLVAGTVAANSGRLQVEQTYVPDTFPRERARALTAHGVRIDAESETFVAHPLLAKANSSHDDTMEAAPMAVRRLTPRECERLQGFPDDYTLITHRGKPAADGPRYRALGNSMAVNCMRWLGARIALVEAVA